MTMHRAVPAVLLLSMLSFVPAATAADSAPERDHVRYVPKTKYPVLKEMKDRDKKLEEEARKKTEEILAAIEDQKKKEREEAKELRFDVSGIVRPAGPQDFQQVWHFPPTPQYLTGTCWSFSVTSFMESEIHRLHGKQIKLSEMWTAYWEYVDKANGFVKNRGRSEFSEGSESNAIQRVWKEYGIVPRSAYEGDLSEDHRFDHAQMFHRMKSFLGWCKENNFWDDSFIVDAIRLILDRTMGRPPETVSWEGKTYTPPEFLNQVCGIRLDDYVELMSTLSAPFWTHAEFKVSDNWWHDAGYINVPLDVWFDVIHRAVTEGYGITLGGDVSEPGLYGKEDIAIIPTFDIPGPLIDQDSREFRIANHTTGDDHGIHLVGHTRTPDGHEWFLIKDSNRSSRLGRFKGYYMYRDDYVKLKMLTIGVHKDLVRDILKKVAATEAAAKEKAAKKPSGEKD